MNKRNKGKTVFITLHNLSTFTCTHTHLTAECLNYWNVGVGLFIPMLFAGLGTGVLFVGLFNMIFLGQEEKWS